jgi:GNAT superfamily N-acetyltransferase
VSSGSVPARLERVAAGETLALRQRVLRPHLTPAEVAFPGDEAPDSAHVVVRSLDGTVVATGSVLREGAPWGAPGWRVRGMAVDEAHRGEGMGGRVLAALLDHVRAQDGTLIWCNARLGAVSLYERAGLRTRGEPWEEPLIGRHIVMWRSL